MSLVTDLSGLLRQRAEALPHKLFLRFPDGDWTYRGFHDAVTIRARGLVDELGDISTPSDRVDAFPPVLPALLPNCREAVDLWFATHRIGWIWAPINTEFRGLGLAHAINLTQSPFLVVDELLLPQVLDVAEDLEHVTTLLVRRSTGNEWSPPRGFRSLCLEDIASLDSELPAPPEDPERTVLLIYTSGTTGPSKACRLSAYYVVRQGGLMSEWLGILESDVLFCPFPLFHWDATIGTIVPALLEGATAVIAKRFSVSRFWPDVRRYGVTVFDFMGATLGFLHKQEPREDDADTTARLGWGVPMPAFKAEFEHRFGLELVEGYGSTEGGVMAFQKSGKEYPAGSCGEELPESPRTRRPPEVSTASRPMFRRTSRRGHPGTCCPYTYGSWTDCRRRPRRRWRKRNSRRGTGSDSPRRSRSPRKKRPPEASKAGRPALHGGPWRPTLLKIDPNWNENPSEIP